MNFNSRKIPREMKDMKNWVLYKKDTRDNPIHPKKVMISVSGTYWHKARSNNKDDWSHYYKSLNTLFKTKYDGLAFVLDEGIIFIDVDNSIDENGNLSPLAQELLDKFPDTMACIYGLRKEEVLGLKWDAIDFQYKQITIKHTVTEAIVNGKRMEIGSDTTKTKKSFRTLPFDPSGIVENMLLEMKENQDNYRLLYGNCYDMTDSEYIYLRPNGKRYKTNWITENFKRFLEKNNLRVIRFHDLRHTCATMLRHTGVPMEDIQKFLGHSTITTTEGIYAHFDDSKHKATITKLSNYLSDKTLDDEFGNVIDKESEKLIIWRRCIEMAHSQNRILLIVEG